MPVMIRPMSFAPKPDRVAEARAIIADTDDVSAEAKRLRALWSIIEARDEAIEAFKIGRAEALKNPAAQRRVMERLVSDIRDGDFTMSEVLDRIIPPEMG